jgi:hypothetical protein
LPSSRREKNCRANYNVAPTAFESSGTSGLFLYYFWDHLKLS